LTEDPYMSEAARDALAHAHIQSLLALYYQALDRGDLETLERRVMAEDAVWEFVQHAANGRLEDRAEGRDGVIAWFRGMLSGNFTMSESQVRHFINTHVIEIDGASARSSSHLQCVDTKSLSIVAVGTALAEHVETPEGWRIRRYRIEEHITEADMAAFQAAMAKTPANTGQG
jgi:hypothetical protein